MSEILQFTDEELKRATELNQSINVTLDKIQLSYETMASSFTSLGVYLLEVRSKKFWLLWRQRNGHHYGSFNDYIVKGVVVRINRHRSQIYKVIGIAEKLLPYMSESTLESMGVTKAGTLAQYVRQTNQKPSEAMIEKAVNPKVDVDTLRAEVFSAKSGCPPAPTEKYRDLGGIFATDDEWQEIQDTIELAKHVDPIVPDHWPPHIQLKVALLKLVQHFRSWWEADVKKGESLGR